MWQNPFHALFFDVELLLYMDRGVNKISMQVRLKYKESSPKFYRDSPNIRLVTWTCWIGSYQLILCRFYLNCCRLSADLIQAVPYLMPAAISWSGGGSTWTGARHHQLIWCRFYLPELVLAANRWSCVGSTWTGASLHWLESSPSWSLSFSTTKYSEE